MRIRKVVIKKLFGIFNHSIPLNLRKHITIIYGPNGFGKTIILKLLKALFSSSYYDLRHIPFSELAVTFDDKSILTVRKIQRVTKSVATNRPGGTKLTFMYKKGQKRSTHVIEPFDVAKLRVPIRYLEQEIKGLSRIDNYVWYFRPTREYLATEDVLQRFGPRIGISYEHVREINDKPKWFQQIRKSIGIRFINTERLLCYSQNSRAVHPDEQVSTTYTVIRNSKRLAKQIQQKLAEYASLSQKLDRSFPLRVMKTTTVSGPSMKELRKKFVEIEEKRQRLVTAGLLDKEAEIDFKKLRMIGSANTNFLRVFTEDVEKKLSVFDKLTDKIDLLVNKINNRFTYKKLTIDKQQGFIFRTNKGRFLPLSNLSSGEQHELVLLYDLLFNVTKDSLILIDEPEISLHVLWQHQFLQDMQEITSRGEFDILIATHSPQIIGNQLDLMVELTGPRN